MPTSVRTTMTDVVNYSGLLYSKTDKNTRLLDAIFQRGREGGSLYNTFSVEFVLANSYELEPPIQPNISEQQSLIAPPPKTTEREQESNVVQIFQQSVAVSFMKQTNFNALGGVNLANVQNNVANELDFQIGRRIDQIRMDLNYTLVNGVYQYTPGSTTVAPRTRGLMAGIVSNKFDNAGKKLSTTTLNNAIMMAIANGLDPAGLEIWVNPDMMDVITKTFIALPGVSLPSSRTEGGAAFTNILTNYGELTVNWDTTIPTGNMLLLNMLQLAVAGKPYFGEDGVNMGIVVYWPLAREGASERGMVYSELGFDYGAEWHHALVENIGEASEEEA